MIFRYNDDFPFRNLNPLVFKARVWQNHKRKEEELIKNQTRKKILLYSWKITTLTGQPSGKRTITLHCTSTKCFEMKAFFDHPLSPCIILRKFYEISSDFPENVLLIRSASERKRTIYFVSTGLAAMLRNVDQEKFNVSNISFLPRES
jgi:hypothetical protein